MSYSPCDSQMSPDPLRYILCTLLVMNILSLPTLSLICPWTIPLGTFVSTIIVIIKSILTLDSKNHECSLSCFWRAMGSYRVHSGGVIIPCTDCHELFPQSHQKDKMSFKKKQKRQKTKNMPLSDAFPSSLLRIISCSLTCLFTASIQILFFWESWICQLKTMVFKIF